MISQLTSPQRHLTFRQNVLLSFYWLAFNVQWTALIVIVVPRTILALVGRQDSTTVLSTLVVIGSLVGAAVLPVAGWLSDRMQHRWGRRRPYILLGAWGNVLGLLIMSGAGKNLALFIAGYLFIQLSSNVAQAAYQALIPDLVQQSQRGVSSGYMGFMTQMAIVFGALIPRLFAGVFVYWFLAGMIILGWAITQWGVSEKDSRTLEIAAVPLAGLWRQFWISPRQHPDFWWVFLTRLMVMTGFGTLENYIFYYLKFTAGLSHPESAVLIILVLLTGGSLISVLLAGWLSDRWHRRKALVVAGGLTMGTASLVFVFTKNYDMILLMGIVYGIGYGTYLSTDWALGVDVLPQDISQGRSMGIWQTSFNLAQVLATAVGGALIALLAPHYGLAAAYRWLFLITFGYFAGGSALIKKVAGAH
ncbi:MAG: MFS transporter [Firmicutes bacterium]|nr:MFS transporter [Bacillota bacterium]